MNRLRTQDLMTARVCALLANLHRASEAARVFVPQDFMLFPARGGPGDSSTTIQRPNIGPVRQSEQEQLAILERFNKLFGGHDNRPRRPGVN